MRILQAVPARLALAITVLPFVLLPEPARAQTEPPADPVVQSPQAEGLGEGPPPGMDGDRFMLGVGAAYMPVHHGSNKYRFQPLPAIDIKWGPLFANFQNGIGATAIDSEHLTIGAGLVPVDGYRAKDVPTGVGKLSMGLGGRGFISLKNWGFEATVGATKVITGSTGGFLLDASLSHPIMVSPKLMLVPSIGTTWADKKHNNRYFGIDARQAAASGLSRFTTGSGFLDAKIDIGAMYRLTDRITFGASGGVTTLLGDVKNSPIVERKTRPFGLVFVGYSF